MAVLAISDALQLIMWTQTNDPAVLALRIFFPLAAVYGYINWKKLIGTPKTTAKRTLKKKSSKG